LFWYGFDPDETTSTADRTMFGGTKGKFNGLDLLSDLNDNRSGGKKNNSKRRQQKRSNDDDEEEEDDDDYDYLIADDRGTRRDLRRRLKADYYEEYYEDDEGEDEVDSNRNNDYYEDEEFEYEEVVDFDDVYDVVTEYSDKSLSIEDKSTFSSRDKNRDRERTTEYDRVEDDPDIMNRQKKRGRREGSSSINKRKPQRRRKSSVSRSRTGARKATSNTDVLSWFEDEEDNDTFKSRSIQRDQNLTPILNIMDKVFGVDPIKIESDSKMYNRNVGIDKTGRPISRTKYATTTGAAASQRGQRSSTKMDQDVGAKRRKGYAYRYDEQVTDNLSSSPDLNTSNKSAQDYGSSNGPESIIDVEATGNPEESTVNPSIQLEEEEEEDSSQNNKNAKPSSWKDRAEAYERIPPKGVSAWGPKGEIAGGDARKQAAMDAMEEISHAQNVVRKKKIKISQVEKDMISLKKEALTQRKRLSLLSDDDDDLDSYSIIREKLMMINAEVEEVGRFLRRLRKETEIASERLNKLESRHEALLSQVQADEELLAVAKQKTSGEQQQEPDKGNSNGSEVISNGNDNDEEREKII